jgi:hypothetical protein
MKLFIGLVIGYVACSYMPEKDEAELKEQARLDLVKTCQVKKYNEIHQFDCIVINKHLAVKDEL